MKNTLKIMMILCCAVAVNIHGGTARPESPTNTQKIRRNSSVADDSLSRPIRGHSFAREDSLPEPPPPMVFDSTVYREQKKKQEQEKRAHEEYKAKWGSWDKKRYAEELAAYNAQQKKYHDEEAAYRRGENPSFPEREDGLRDAVPPPLGID